MAFLDDVDGLRTKIHASGVPRPVLVGVAVLAIVVVVLVAWNAVGALQAAGAAKFEIERAGASTDAAGSARADAEENDASGEGGGDPANEETAGTNVDGSDGDSNTVFVHVAGAVAAPGVYEVASGARVQDAIDAAGGFAAEAAQDSVNRARTVRDGEQILVPTVEESQGPVDSASGQSGAPAASAAGAMSGAGAPGAKVNINQASAEELDALPGVGPSTAAKIIADREANGPFSEISDLMRVSGIGEKKYEQLSSLITV